ncbi:alpha/beta hydrolase [Streptomyces thermocarboxydovorans]|uniref:Alpha/beta hydrolase n=1 Tax=Streptomyces thermocarboxydovorans TaxID=59298 RepID=A0ABP3T1E0_9ACTN
MPLDSAVESLIAGLAEQGFTSFEKIGLEPTRQVIETFVQLQKPPEDVAEVIDARYGDHPEQAVRLYVPEGDGPFPVVVYFHGGGFVGGGLDVVEEPCRALANDTGALVVAATYRRAPEARFPAATDDTFAALRWSFASVAEHRGDPERIAVMGDSAGGYLAAVAAVRARDAGLPALRAQVLVYPLIDPVADTAPQGVRRGLRHPPRRPEVVRRTVHRLAGAVTDPWLAVNRTPSLENLPPALILTNEYDTLRDEAEDYGRRLAAAGVETTVSRFDGMVHGVYWMSAAIPRQKEYRDAISAFLKDRLAPDGRRGTVSPELAT